MTDDDGGAIGCLAMIIVVSVVVAFGGMATKCGDARRTIKFLAACESNAECKLTAKQHRDLSRARHHAAACNIKTGNE